MAQEIYIIRHAIASHNMGDGSRQTFAGGEVDHHLTKEGRDTAALLANHLLTFGKIDLIIHSGLKRSEETAKILAQTLKAPLFIMEDLREINVGDFAGHTKEEVNTLYPEAARAFYSGDIKKWSFPNGENFLQVAVRTKKALTEISQMSHEKIIIVGHGMANRVIFYQYLPQRTDLWRETSYPHDRIVKLELK